MEQFKCPKCDGEMETRGDPGKTSCYCHKCKYGATLDFMVGYEEGYSQGCNDSGFDKDGMSLG